MELKFLNTVHLRFCLAIIMFGVSAFLIVGNQAYFSTQLGNISPYFLLLPLVGLIAITIGSSVYKQGVSKAKEQASFESKLNKFKQVFLIRCALIEASAFLNIVGFILSSNLIFLAFGGISLLSLWSCRVVKQKLIDDLEISLSDAERL